MTMMGATWPQPDCLLSGYYAAKWTLNLGHAVWHGPAQSDGVDAPDGIEVPKWRC